MIEYINVLVLREIEERRSFLSEMKTVKSGHTAGDDDDDAMAKVRVELQDKIADLESRLEKQCNMK